MWLTLIHVGSPLPLPLSFVPGVRMCVSPRAVLNALPFHRGPLFRGLLLGNVQRHTMINSRGLEDDICSGFRISDVTYHTRGREKGFFQFSIAG